MKNLAITVIAMALVLGVYERYKKKEAESHIHAAYVAQGLLLANGIKNQIFQYYRETGRLPTSNAEVGLPLPELFASGTIARIAIGAGGVIAIHFRGMSGQSDDQIRLAPDVTQPGSEIVWRCTTSSFKNITAWAPQCRFDDRISDAKRKAP